MRGLSLASAVLAGALAACAASQNGPPAGEDLQPLRSPALRLQQSGLEDAADQVIASEAAWIALWQHMTRNRLPAAPAPAVDFARYVVLVSSMGKQPGGGREIRIGSLQTRDGKNLVQVMEISPGAGCIVTSGLTFPADIALLARRLLPVEFVRSRQTRDCN